MSVPGGLVRLAIRVRASDADVALARLLPLFPGGAEERALGGSVEYALYGAPDELPDEASLRTLAGDALLEVVRAPVPGGWETAWHEHLGRVAAGGFAIRPPWIAGAPEDIVIEPGLTFGAAGHPTTRLCLELLAGLAARVPGSGERRATRGWARSGVMSGVGDSRIARLSDPAGPASPPRPGETGPLPSRPFAGARHGDRLGALCDWGCGSGVLAIAAARLGFEPVHAVDNDPAAVALARENARANGVDIDVRRLDLTRERPPWAPTVVANLTLPLLQAAAALDAPRPRGLIASGVLAGQADAAVAAWGMRERERREADGWAALLLEAR